MTEPAPAPQATSADGVRPIASLATIPVSRRRAPPAVKGKRGDLTAKLTPALEPAPAAQQPPEQEPTIEEPAAQEPPPEALTLAFQPKTLPTPEAGPIDAPPEFAPTADELRCAGEFLAYWEKLRGRRAFPELDEIDRSFVATGWQDSMIVDFAFAPTMPHIARLGRPSGAVAYMPLMTDWILSRGRQAARRGVPLDEVQVFEGEGESLRFRVLLLPLGTANGASDCVLCHLSRTS